MFNEECSICGGNSFTFGPGGRLSAYGMLPFCIRCHSLERHRALRNMWSSINSIRDLKEYSALQISEDACVEREWFNQYEVSVYGTDSSIDIQQIDRRDASYDIVICNHVLEHVENDVLALREMMRIVSDKGFLQLSVPDPFRKLATEDWGYPKKEDHGHYRIYGRDIIKLFREALPDHFLFTVLIQDSVTKSEDVAFFISRNYDLRYFYPHFEVKSFQKLTATSELFDFEIAVKSAFPTNTSGDPRYHIYSWPDFSLTNPYQTLLCNSFPAPITSSAGNIDTAIKALVERPQDNIIFHQHWTGPILPQNGTPEYVKKMMHLYCDKIQTFKEMGGKVIWTVHNILNHEGIHAAEEMELCRFLAEVADKVHVHTLSTISLTTPYYTIPTHKLIIAPHGSYVGHYKNTIDKETARASLGLPLKARVFLFFGQIRKYKGLQDLVDAFLRTEDKSTYLLVVGDPGVMDAMDLSEICIPNERIKYIFEHVPDDEIQLYFNCADICVFPYQNILTSGSVILAMSFGRPVIAPNIGSLNDTILHEKSGWLYEQSDTDGLAMALKRASTTPEHLLSKMSEICLEMAASMDWKNTGRLIAESIISPNFGNTIIVETTKKNRCLERGYFSSQKATISRTATIVVHFNNLEDTCQCIDSLKSQKESDLYIVSNDEDLVSYIFLCKKYPDLPVLQSPENLGYAGGNNLALNILKEKGYEFFWLVNPDILSSPTALAQLEKAADEHHDYSGFGPIIFFADNPERIWYGGGEVNFLEGLAPRHLYYGQTLENIPKDPWPTSYITGASFFFRASLLDDIGLLPEDFFLYFEETHWCLTASTKGHKFLVLPSIHLRHHKRSDIGGAPTLTYIYYFTRNWILVCARWNPNAMERAISNLNEFYSNWSKLIEQFRPDDVIKGKSAFSAGIKDGLKGKTGRVDLNARLKIDNPTQ